VRRWDELRERLLTFGSSNIGVSRSGRIVRSQTRYVSCFAGIPSLLDQN
jgi:hypothetical protein